MESYAAPLLNHGIEHLEIASRPPFSVFAHPDHEFSDPLFASGFYDSRWLTCACLEVAIPCLWWAILWNCVRCPQRFHLSFVVSGKDRSATDRGSNNVFIRPFWQSLKIQSTTFHMIPPYNPDMNWAPRSGICIPDLWSFLARQFSS